MENPNCRIYFSDIPTSKYLIRYYSDDREGLAVVTIRKQTKKYLQAGFFLATACSSRIKNMTGIIFSYNVENDAVFFIPDISFNLKRITDNEKFIEEFNEGVKNVWYLKRVSIPDNFRCVPVESTNLILLNGYINFESTLYRPNAFLTHSIFSAKINFTDLEIEKQ